MTLKEYTLGDRNFLFEEGEQPEDAELVGDVAESVSPGSFETLVDPHPVKAKAAKQPANKAAPAPDNK